MPKYRVKAKVVLEVETEFDDAEGEGPDPETMAFCLQEDLAEGPWGVNKITVTDFERKLVE